VFGHAFSRGRPANHLFSEINSVATKLIPEIIAPKLAAKQCLAVMGYSIYLLKNSLILNDKFFKK
jgi:hypothetical protein